MRRQQGERGRSAYTLKTTRSSSAPLRETAASCSNPGQPAGPLLHASLPGHTLQATPHTHPTHLISSITSGGIMARAALLKEMRRPSGMANEARLFSRLSLEVACARPAQLWNARPSSTSAGRGGEVRSR